MRPKLKSLFFGTPAFSIPSLKACLEKTELLGIVTQPDRPKGRGKKMLPSDIKAWAQEHAPHIPVFTPLSLRKSAEDEASKNCQQFLESQEVDLYIVTAYGNILPQRILDQPKIAPINIHTSLLPRWRGAAPIQRALEAGDTKTGVALQKMVFKLDEGPVLKSKNVDITAQMDALNLSQKLSDESYPVLCELLNEITQQQSLPAGTPQDENKATYAHKIKKDEGFWSSGWTAQDFHNKCRAFRAWPQVEAQLSGDLSLKILKTRIPAADAPKLQAGAILLSQKKAFVGCAEGGGTLELLEVKIPGKAAAPAFQALENLLKKTGQSELSFLEH